MAKTENASRPVRSAFDRAIVVASKDGLITDFDAGTVRAAQALADKIDAWDQIVEWAFEDMAEAGSKRPAVPQNDNVSLPSFLKYCEALGLTPASRAALKKAAGGSKEGGVGKLEALKNGVGLQAFQGGISA